MEEDVPVRAPPIGQARAVELLARLGFETLGARRPSAPASFCACPMTRSARRSAIPAVSLETGRFALCRSNESTPLRTSRVSA